MEHIMKINEMFPEDDIIEKKTIAFLKYLEKSNMIKKGSYKNKTIVDGIKMMVADPEAYKKEDNPTIQFFLSNFEEWDELYGSEVI